jgi:hypothetical protein
MLFSSGDSPQNASSILSGEGLDEAQPGESPFVVSAVCHFLPRVVLLRNGDYTPETDSSPDTVATHRRHARYQG